MQISRKPWLLVMLLALSLSTLTACDTIRSIGIGTRAERAEAPTDVACQVFDGITYSVQNDSPETIRQIVSFNAALVALCPEKLPQ
jgi:hypothetical protein